MMEKIFALPPRMRSRAALGMTGPAATGRFALQTCEDCNNVQYPPREFCRKCLSSALVWRDQPRQAEVLAEATIYHSLEPAFSGATAPRTALVRHGAGVVLVAFLTEGCRAGDTVHLSYVFAPGGSVVVQADPPAIDKEKASVMTSTPRPLAGLNCYLTDSENPLGQACTSALRDAGAANVWGPASRDADDSRVELVVETNWYAGTGENTSLGQRIEAHLELAGRFAPVLADRKGAWVSALSFAALSAYPGQPRYSAQMAAAQALAISLRARLLNQGARLVAAYPAKLDIEEHQSVGGSTLSWPSLALALVTALQNGHEDVYPDPQSRLWLERLTKDRKALEREMAMSSAP
jgi:uncharacterized OB-fold protein